MIEAALSALLVLIGLSGGLAVGTGMVAFLVVLDIIPRMAQIARSFHRVHLFEAAVVTGVLFWTALDFFDWKLSLFPAGVGLIGFLAGAFVGMLAGALTEVLNVFPIMARRIGMGSYILLLLMAMVFGKIAGSLFDFLWFRMD